MKINQTKSDLHDRSVAVLDHQNLANLYERFVALSNPQNLIESKQISMTVPWVSQHENLIKIAQKL